MASANDGELRRLVGRMILYRIAYPVSYEAPGILRERAGHPGEYEVDLGSETRSFNHHQVMVNGNTVTNISQPREEAA